MTKLSVGEDISKLQLPNDWSEIKIQKLLDKGLLIDHLDGNHGELYPSAEEFSDEGVPYVSANNFSNGVVDLEGCKKLPEARAKQFKKGIARNDDVIFAHNATVGPVALLKTDLDYVILGTTATYYRCNNDKLLNHYLLYAMQSNFFVQQYSKVMFQSTRSQVPITAQRKLSLLVPSYPEQKAIAQVLSKADAAIHTTEKLIAQKELRKKWLMQQLLTGKKRLKGFEGEWKENKLEYFIKDYKQKPTDEDTYEVLTSAKTGLMKQTDYYGDNRITNRDDADYNVIPPNYLTYRSRSDDGLFTFNKNDLGITGLISGYYPVFTIKNGDINFILMFMNYYRQKLTKYAIGTSQLVLAMNALKEAKFNLPIQEEQTAIAQVLQAADKEISLLKAKAEKLREQKKGLMQVLLTGKVRLKIIDTNERIK